MPVTGAGWERELERSAASTGVDANLMRKIAGKESGNNPNARASTSTAGGLFQFLDSTWSSMAARYGQLGLTNKMSAEQQARAAPYYMKEIQENLHRKLGRAPDDAESYLGWFLGPVGSARALGASADTPVEQVVDAASIAANRAVFKNIRTVGDLYNWSAKKMASSGARASYTVSNSSLAEKAQRMGTQVDLSSTQTRVPFTFEDKRQQEIDREKEAYSLVEATRASISQDWMMSNLLKQQGKVVYDPGFNVTPDTLKRDDIKALPPSYLPYLSKSMSQQDLDFRVSRAQQDFEVEKRLSHHPYLRMAVGMADPAGIALAAVAPAGFAANLARAGKAASLLAGVSDAAIGSYLTEVPALMNKPGYEPEQALWAGITGTAGYALLNRHMWAGRGHDEVMEGAVKGLYDTRKSLENGSFGSGSAGAAQVAGYRDPVRNDIEGIAGLQTEKSGAAWMDRLRFDTARHKNSENSLIAAVADHLVQDPVGNRDTSTAVSRSLETRARHMKEQQDVFMDREYIAASNDFRQRNNISYHAWEFGGVKEQFQREASKAVRNESPTTTFDPAVERWANAWRKNAAEWHSLASNPGRDLGETFRPVPGFDTLEKNPHYLPRYTNWDRFNELNGEFGNDLRRLLGEAIARKNPDLDADFAHQLGGYYYDRLARVEAGQEMNTMKALSGSDMEALRRDLVNYGLDNDAVNRALYQLDQSASESGGKTMTSRQKRRTLMDENFSLQLSGRNGSREVKVAELWEDNLHAISNAYNRQMSSTVAFAQMRIENPRWKVGDPASERYIIDGLHSEGDWKTLEAKIRAHDAEIRHGDRLKTAEAELRDLKFAFDSIRGVPNDIDRTRLGQAMRIVQNVNFVRLMSQAGWSSVAEFGKSMGEFGVRHMLKTIPGFRDFMRDAKTGKLLRDELEDWEYHFTAGTDHLRGVGGSWKSGDVASAMNDGASTSSRLDRIEAASKQATRVVSSMSLAPLTTFQERWAMKAAISKFRDAADNMEKRVLSEKRMRVIGLDADMQKRVLQEIKKHDSWVYGENGRKVRILGLEKWEPQTRSAFEHAISTWTRRAIQQNDIGQMNAVMGSPFAKLLFQFRTFTIGAWSKQTLSSLHLHEANDLFGFMASMMFGSMAYAVQTNLNTLWMNEEDRKKVHDERLNPKKIAMAGFQRAGASSLIPGMWDFGTGMIGLDPLFDTRSTQQPTKGLAANPTLGLIDSIHGATRGLTTAAYPDGHLTSGDVRRALTILGNFPGFVHMVNATSAPFPAQ
ncbi:transglycosylase SLT domain-containing protein [Methylobacterium sp. NFXW15]|uniref:transglycosylase SLT domain-containing protein n=1 Tax=Methylobacterium sp. NFXW15 TaxID=2819512 RepID=UPI003CF8229C